MRAKPPRLSTEYAGRPLLNGNFAIYAVLPKIRVLENSLYSAKEAAAEIAGETGCEVVQILGTRITLYRKNPEKPVIQLDD